MGRKLGQHFLINRSAIKKIVASLSLGHGDHVIEIGPGTGALTVPLAKRCARIGCTVTAVEKDEGLVEEVRGRRYEVGMVIEVVRADILSYLTSSLVLRTSPYKLVGNIPYYLTGSLLRLMSDAPRKPAIAVITIQQEVAERLCAQTPRMNLLAAATQVWAKPKILMRLAPADFDPPPKVASAIVSLTPHQRQLEEGERLRYYALIKRMFKQPRKTIVNNLRAGKTPTEDIKTVLLAHGLSGSERPQDLSVEILRALSEDVSSF